MTDALDALDRLAEQAEPEYRKLAERIAQGEEIGPAAIAELLSAAGRTRDDLRRHVDAIRYRARLVAASRPRVDPARQADEARLAEIEAELSRREAEHRAAVEPLQAEALRLSNRLRATRRGPLENAAQARAALLADLPAGHAERVRALSDAAGRAMAEGNRAEAERLQGEIVRLDAARWCATYIDWD